jgi:hypothetical protein
MLPLSNSINYPNDLIENAIKVVGEEDGITTMITFYFWRRNEETGRTTFKSIRLKIILLHYYIKP